MLNALYDSLKIISKTYEGKSNKDTSIQRGIT